MSTTSQTASQTSPSTHPQSGGTRAPEPDLWVSREAESRRQQRAAWAAEVLPALLEAPESRRRQPVAWAVEVLPALAMMEAPQSRRQQPVAWAVEVLPALLVVEAESEVVDRAPQASRYSDSLFRQPLLFSFLS